MGAIPGSVETDAQPPMTVPLRHFVVGLAFVLAGGVVGTLAPLGVLGGGATLAHVHLLLAGWVCVTIMGAMTQFVPVWSGVTLHSERLAVLELHLVSAGLVGFAGALLAGAFAFLPVFGVLMLAGFWTFAYNIGRTLLVARPWDVTERHFALALVFFLVVTGFGLVLATSFARPGLLAGTPITQVRLRDAHATLAVFGAVLTTVLGALYQLGTMFTQADLRGVDYPIRRFEETAFPAGVVTLAAGRLVGSPTLGRVGGLLVVAALLAFALLLARRLRYATVERTPMLTRYGVVAVAMAAWALRTLPAWYARPTAPSALFGPQGAVHLLLFGVVGFVVLGTLYHVVPFIVWVHRYSDRLGLESVPMIDDLYDDRLAALDFGLLTGGSALLVLAEAASLPPSVTALGGALSVTGFVVFAANMVLVVRRHSPHPLVGLLLPSVAAWRETAGGDARSEP